MIKKFLRSIGETTTEPPIERARPPPQVELDFTDGVEAIHDDDLHSP